MTDREKITAILKAYTKKHNISASSVILEEYAEELIANGVIVPPCKVGDIVYVIEPCSCFSGYRTFEECHKRRTNATKWIEAVMVANKHHNRCMKLFERPYKPEYYFKIGKTVFLTKEEAEAELRKRGEDNA